MKELKELPYVGIMNGSLQIICDSLEPLQIARIVLALYEFIQNGTEPTFETKVERGAWKNLIDGVMVNYKSYCNTANNGAKGGQYGYLGAEYGKLGGRPLKGETAEEARLRRIKEFEEKKQQEIMANTNFDNEAPAQPYRPIEAPQISIDSLLQPSVSAPVNQPNNGYERHSNFVGYISDNMPAAYKNTTPTYTMNEYGFPVCYIPVIEAHKKDFNHCVEVYGDKSSYEAQIGVLMRNYNLDTTYKSQFAQYLKGLAA